MENVRIFEDYSEFCITKIEVILTLDECPSDYRFNRYCMDVDANQHSQENCYIGEWLIDRISLEKIRNADIENGILLPQWKVAMIINNVVLEEEAVKIINKLCEVLSYKTLNNSNHTFQNYGFGAFQYSVLDLKRFYAGKDGVFGDQDYPRHGQFESNNLSKLADNIFLLPEKLSEISEIQHEIQKQFLIAMCSKDNVSRYILAYCCFEIMYDSVQYQNIKKELEKEPTHSKLDRDKKRSKILFRYLSTEYSLHEYNFFTEKFDLTEETLESIIKTRNDLTHRGDQKKISSLLYYHLIPILRAIIRTFDSSDRHSIDNH